MPGRNTSMRDGEIISIPVAASTFLYAGRMIAIDTSGDAVPASDTAGLKVVGRAEEDVDNLSGAAGEKSITVRRKKAFWWVNSTVAPLTKAHLNGLAPIYVEDDETVSIAVVTILNNIVAGVGLEIDSSLGVLIETP